MRVNKDCDCRDERERSGVKFKEAREGGRKREEEGGRERGGEGEQIRKVIALGSEGQKQ